MELSATMREKLTNDFMNEFHECDGMSFFSAPGRIELCGNHTDHQNGVVLTAAINREITAAVKCNGKNKIHLVSKGFSKITLDLSNITPATKNDVGNTYGILHGIVNIMREYGYSVNGFDACITSSVKRGSGVSSSAAVEVLLCTIINRLFNGASIPAIELAKISKRAENEYFGKPCGLMDQAAAACGGCIMIDFYDGSNPIIQQVPTQALMNEYGIVIVDCGGSHAGLTAEYAKIVAEQRSVAEFFGQSLLSRVNEDDFYDSIRSLRGRVGDRAVLRAKHYFDECRRVIFAKNALIEHDFSAFFSAISESGRSSCAQLQNVYPQASGDRSLLLSLALTDRFMTTHCAKGAYRIHGGGFCGTTLTIIDKAHIDEYAMYMKQVFSDVDCVSIREFGGVACT